MKLIFALFFVLCLMTMPAAAQEASLLDWIPADFAGFVRIDTSNPELALAALNRGAGIVSILQPTRLALESALSFDDFFPLAMLDVESASFNTTILPWLGDELIIAYRSLPSDYRADSEDVLVILASDNSFAAPATMADVIQAQDLLESTTYRGLTIYRGDQVSLAFTPVAVLIGPDALVRAALDAEAGETPSLTSDPVFQTVHEALNQDAPLYSFLQGEAAAAGFAYMLGASDDGASLLSALGQAFADLSRVETVTSALLNGDIDALGASVQFVDFVPRSASANVVLHTSEEGLVESSSAFDATVLEYIPRSALVVHSGTDAQNMAYATVTALPTANFAARVLGGFPVTATTGALSTLPSPSNETLESAINSFADAVEEVNGISIFEDVLDNFDGSYSIALLPRPNDPLPIVNTPFDALLVAQVNDGEAMVETLSDLLQLFVGADNVQTERLDDHTFTTLMVPDTDDPFLRIGVVDDLLIVATGDTARAALSARRGDNRLIEQPRWQAFTAAAPPDLFVDIPAFYNTFLPSSGGQVGGIQSQIGLHSRSIGGGFYEYQLRFTLPSN
jgi:hypothetical protein